MDKKIIDVHAHSAGIGEGSPCFVSERIAKSLKFPIWLKAFGVSKKELQKEGDELVIKRIADWISDSKEVDGTVVITLDGVMNEKGELDKSQTEIYVDDDFTAETIKKHKNLYFGASVNPLRKDALERLEKAKANGAVLVKWLPAIQFFNPGNPDFKTFYEKLVELDLPLLSHVGDEDTFTITKNELCNPAHLSLALDVGVTVIAPHMASKGSRDGMSNFDRLVAMMKKHNNLYSDISALTQFNRRQYLKPSLNDKEIASKLLYGTDHPLSRTPLVTPLQYAPQIGFKKTFELMGVQNPFDRDLRLKKALGVGYDILQRGAEVLKIK